MKKLLILFVFFFVASIATLAGLGYYANSQLLPQLPAMAANALKPMGYNLTVGAMDPTSVPFSMALRNVRLAGPASPVLVEADQISMQPSIAFQFPPLRISIRVKQLTLSDNSTSSPVPRQPSSVSPPTRMAALLALFGWMKADLTIDRVAAPTFGVLDSSFRASLDGIHVSDRTLDHMVINHTLVAKRLTQYAFLQGIQWTGQTTYVPDKIEAKDHLFTLGPLSANATAQLSLASKKWSCQASLPKTDFSRDLPYLKAAMPPWLLSATGEVQGGIRVQGIGSTLASSFVDGEFEAKKLELNLRKPEITGKVLADVSAKITRREHTELDVRANADLTHALFNPDPEFKKPIGIPLKLDFALNGNEEHFSVPTFMIQFLNATVKGKGEGRWVPSKFVSVEMRLPKTEMAGWERFFPNYTELKAGGTLEGQLAYQGPPAELRKGDLRLQLNATKVTIPVWSKLIPTQAIKIQGMVGLNSSTELQWSDGVVRKLSTKTELDLTKAEARYEDLFLKPMNVRALLDLSVLSATSRAQIKRMNLQLGGLRGNATGSIENFKQPVAKIKFSLVPTSPGMLFAFSPRLTERGISDTRGVVSIKGNLTGPFLKSATQTANFRRVDAIIEARELDMNQLITAQSPKMKDVMEGRISGKASLTYLNELSGSGFFNITDGVMKTLQFTQKPLEMMQKIPLLGSRITKTTWEEKFQNIHGDFKIQNEAVHFSDLVMRSPYFDFDTKKTTYQFTHEISGTGDLTLKDKLVSGEVLNALKDASGRPTIPLQISGTLQSPVIAIQGDLLQKKIQSYLERQIANEKDKLLQGVRKNVEQKAREAIQNIFK